MQNQKVLIGIITVLALTTLGLSWTLLSTSPSFDSDDAQLVELHEDENGEAEDELDDDAGDDDQEVSDQELTTTQADSTSLEPGYLITVHIEPTQNPNVEMESWLTLVKLVDLSNEYDMKLSLHFSASMASLVTDNMEFIDTVRYWEREGHEIGVHHHDPSHASWDGYTDDKKLIRNKDYIGTIDDMMQLVSALSVDGEVLTGSGTNNPDEWPEGVIYGSKGSSPPSYKEMIMPAVTQTLGNTIVTFLTKAPFNVDMVKSTNSATYERIEDAIDDVGLDEYMGLTVTDHTLDDQGLEDLERVFQLYVDNDIHTQTIEVLLNR